MYLEISNPMDYHVALYIRLSKEDESEGPSESVTNQKSLLNEFVQQHRLSVYDTYIDDGWSGTSFNRPAFQRMIGDIETKKVNMVITKDLSRLGRDYIMTGHYMERYFPEKRVRYISLLDGIDTGIESTANDITPFRAIMNDMYAKDISKKIKSVKHDKQQKGQFIGGKPVYGYKMHPTEKNKIRLYGNMFEELTPVKGLTIRAAQAMDAFDYRYRYKSLPARYNNYSGSAAETFQRYSSFTLTNTAEYKFDINKSHNLTALVGQESIIYDGSSFGTSVDGITDSRLSMVSHGTTYKAPSASLKKKTMNSFFARAEYNFNEKYYLDASYRTDGSSLFGVNKRWASFFSVGAMWNMKKEQFRPQFP